MTGIELEFIDTCMRHMGQHKTTIRRTFMYDDFYAIEEAALLMLVDVQFSALIRKGSA